jgi:hypothetical protein
MKPSISKRRIALGVGITLFAVTALFGLVTGPSPGPGVEGWTARVKLVLMAAAFSTAVVAFLATCAAFLWVWFRTGRALGRVPRYRLDWILNPEGLSHESKEARLWLLWVYGPLFALLFAILVLELLGGL